MDKRRTLRSAAAIVTLSVASLTILIDAEAAESQCAATCKAGNTQAASEVRGSTSRLSEAEIQKVVGYVLSQVEEGGVNPLQFEADQIEEATGVIVNEHNQAQVVPVLVAKLQQSTQGRAVLAAVESGASCSSAAGATESGSSCSPTSLASGSGCSVGGPMSRCTEYGACSLSGNLAYASDDVLEMYSREKAMDGQKFANHQLPAFEARDLNGRVVRSADLSGMPTLVVTLAAHCSHSYDTLPILKKLQEHYGGEVQVVGVYVNSGSVEDVGLTIQGYSPNFDVWVHAEDSLGDVLESHLVPTYLLVDGAGMVQEKLVGFKSEQEIKSRIDTIMVSHSSTSGSVGSEE